MSRRIRKGPSWRQSATMTAQISDSRHAHRLYGYTLSSSSGRTGSTRLFPVGFGRGITCPKRPQGQGTRVCITTRRIFARRCHLLTSVSSRTIGCVGLTERLYSGDPLVDVRTRVNWTRLHDQRVSTAVISSRLYGDSSELKLSKNSMISAAVAM